MFSIIGLVMGLILTFYVVISLLFFFNFIFRGCNVTVTDNRTDEKYELEGFKKLITCLGICFLWPVVIIQNY